MPDEGLSRATCAYCGGSPTQDPKTDQGAFCSRCGALISLGDVRIEVHGQDASEVGDVARLLTSDAVQRRDAGRLRSPWLSGTFYLAVVVVAAVLLLVVGSVLPLWALPIVVVGVALFLSMVGALQLRQDDRLSELGFIRLMGDALKLLPLAFGRRGRSDGGEAV